jgi:uncharacterized protein
MHLIWSDDVLEEARQTRDRVAAALAEGAVPGDLELTGASGTPGVLTKGDIDLHLRVTPDRFADAVRRLGDAYHVGSPLAWGATLAVFALPGPRPTGLAVTPVGSEHDLRLVRSWREIRLRPDLREAYNRLKRASWRSADYEDQKSAFFTRVVDRRQ